MEKELFDDKNIPESPWFKFEKVGDKVSGVIESVFESPAQGEYPAQRCFALEQEDGSIINVGIAVNKTYLISRTSSAMVGDKLGFRFDKEVPSATKGYAKAKSIEVFLVRATPEVEEAEQFTLREGV